MTAIAGNSQVQRASLSKPEDFRMQSYVSVEQLTTRGAELVIRLAGDYKRRVNDSSVGADRRYVTELRGTTLALVFHESSTRTRISFEAAAKEMGATTLVIADPKSSSMAKGESLKDTVRTLVQYSDGMVLRTPETGAVREIAELAGRWKGRAYPIINAGDGTNEHPTQALGDICTIEDRLRRTDNLNVALLGDLKSGRTVHSLARMLALFPNNSLWCVSDPELSLEHDGIMEQILGFSKEVGQGYRSVTTNEGFIGAEWQDVFYYTRLQEERYKDKPEFLEKIRKTWPRLTTHITRNDFSEEAIVMHPLPRPSENPEIPTWFDDDPRLACWDQVGWGRYARMALLSLIFGLQRHS